MAFEVVILKSLQLKIEFTMTARDIYYLTQYGNITLHVDILVFRVLDILVCTYILMQFFERKAAKIVKKCQCCCSITSIYFHNIYYYFCVERKTKHAEHLYPILIESNEHSQGASNTLFILYVLKYTMLQIILKATNSDTPIYLTIFISHKTNISTITFVSFKICNPLG